MSVCLGGWGSAGPLRRGCRVLWGLLWSRSAGWARPERGRGETASGRLADWPPLPPACSRSLRFDDKPDYAYLRKIFRELFAREGFQWDYGECRGRGRSSRPPTIPTIVRARGPPNALAVFDWTILKYQKAAQQTMPSRGLESGAGATGGPGPSGPADEGLGNEDDMPSAQGGGAPVRVD